VRRVWKCPDCESLIRLAVDAVAAQCDCCGSRQWMNIETEPVLRRFVPPTENPDEISDGPPNSAAANVPNIFPRVQVTKSQKRKRSPRHRKNAANTPADEAEASVADPPATEATQPAETTAEATQPAETAAEATQPAETTAEATQPAETAAEATQPAETAAEATPSAPDAPASPSSNQPPQPAPDSPSPSDTSDEPAAE